MTEIDVAALSREIATELQMTAEPGPSADGSEAWLTRGQEQLRICASRASPGRVTIIGIFPPSRHRSRAMIRARITVNASRGAAVVAREVTRRLLPAYRDLLADVQARNAADAADAAARNAVAAAISATFPPGPGSQITAYQTPGCCVLHVNAACGWGHVRICGDGTIVHLKLSDVPAAAALPMLAALVANAAREAC
jgi:chorismate mutase